jgi:hypothetical protein
VFLPFIRSPWIGFKRCSPSEGHHRGAVAGHGEDCHGPITALTLAGNLLADGLRTMTRMFSKKEMVRPAGPGHGIVSDFAP